MFTQARHAQMGEMISMIAHQWRQPLNAISTAASVIEFKSKREKFSNQEAKEIAEKIQKYTLYLSETIDDFRNFFRPDKEKKATDFKTILEIATNIIEPTLKKANIEFEEKVTTPEQFLTFENELVQVVLNIIKNAHDALIEKQIQNPKIVATIERTSLTISDNAGGVPLDIQEKIFLPYFSTKDNKNGTGLGLYMSKMIIEKHSGGELLVTNSDNGANFTIKMPHNA